MEVLPFDFATLDVGRVIVHEIPVRKKGAATEPTLSEVESPLTANLQAYIKNKITQSATSAYACDVVLQPSGTAPLADRVVAHLSGDGEDFVELSHFAATHLHGVQTGINPEGLLAIVGATLLGHRALAILKLERESGVTVQPANIGGKQTLRIDHVGGLILTKSVRVFKAGVFVHRGPDQRDVDAVVSDHQRGQRPTSDIADFFLKRFLGCELTELPRVTTRRFFEAVVDFVNTQVPSTEHKAKYHIALLAELGGNAGTLAGR